MKILESINSAETREAAMGQTVVVDGKTYRIGGVGVSGVEGKPGAVYGATLKAEDGSELHWSSEHGLETPDDKKARHWRKDWDSASKTARDLISLLFADDFPRVPEHRRKPVAKLLGASFTRLRKRGLIEADTCGRCGGSGRYSYCQMYGDTCFGCGGSGKVRPSASKMLKVAKAQAR